MLSSVLSRFGRGSILVKQTYFTCRRVMMTTNSLNSDMSTHHLSNQIPPHDWGTTKTGSDSDLAYGENPRTSVLMELKDRVGVLHDVLRYFWKYDVNVCRIESRPAKGRGPHKRFDFFVDFEGSLDDEHVRYEWRGCLNGKACSLHIL